MEPDVELPEKANALKIAAARSIEIRAMTESILKPCTTRRIFQTLPVHMRRRVMSHNSKRLPARLRQSHMEQIRKSGHPPTQHRNSRKYRRRPHNLVSEYERRKNNNIWLETHIWHAKRFFMVERWQYKLPERPCDKAFRACYRATSAHCLIEDTSYMPCFHITGDEFKLKECLAKLTNSMCGLTVGAKAYISGSREGSAHFYRENQYPFGYIGMGKFIWSPSESNVKSLWIFFHPGNYLILLQELIKIFPLSLSNEKTLGYDTYTNEWVKLVLLRNFFNRIRLTGPLSQAVVTKTLRCVKQTKLNQSKWAKGVKIEVEEKYNMWDQIQTLALPSELPAGMVIGLIVEDPRINIPKKRIKAVRNLLDNSTESLFVKPPDNAKQSPMWNLEIYEKLEKERKTTADIIKYKTERQLIPGCDVDICQSIPIILIQRPGSQDGSLKRLGYGSGWDIIIPRGYGLAFWHSFILNGARAGGLREHQNTLFECGKCFLSPDTTAGKQEEERIYEEKKNKYFRLPPNKRVNYIKIGINSPFLPRWNVLLKDWIGDTVESFYVLRDSKHLKLLMEGVSKSKMFGELPKNLPCLVPIHFETLGKGKITQNAIICLNNEKDDSFEEKIHKDKSKQRNQLRKAHLKEVKARRSKRKKINRQRKLEGKSMLRSIKKASKPLTEYLLTMKELWLPEDIKTVRKSCCKEVVGYVTQGGFSFTAAKSCAFGYIAYNALIHFIENKQKRLLVRNTTSRMYKEIEFRIIIE